MNKITLHIADKHYHVDQREDGLLVDGKLHDINIHKITENEYSVLIDGHSYHIFFNNCSKYFCAQIDNHVFEIKRHTLRDELSEKFLKKNDDAHSSITFRAPMPGLVTKVQTFVNARVDAGDGIVVVEAMKMENMIKTTKSGIVKKIFVQEKQAVEKGDPLFVIE